MTDRQRGQATVEVALILPVLATLLLSVVQVGVIVRDQILVTHAAREAVRSAAVDPSAAAARAAAADGSGLPARNLQVDVTGRAGPDSRVQVEVVYRARTDVPLVGRLIGDLTLRAAATMRVEVAAGRHLCVHHRGPMAKRVERVRACAGELVGSAGQTAPA